MGVPAQATVLEATSQNSACNAAQTVQTMKGRGVDTMTLVTAVLYGPRARKVIKQAGLKVHAAPSDFEIIDMPFDLLRLLPNTNALDSSSRAFKELLG